MIDGFEEQHNVETEYLDEDLLGKEQTGNQIDIIGEDIQPPTFMEQLVMQANNRACIHAALTIGPRNSYSLLAPEKHKFESHQYIARRCDRSRRDCDHAHFINNITPY